MSPFAVLLDSASPWLPLLVFVAEMCVVTLATLRIIFISRRMKAVAALLGFFEVSIWLFAIGQIMQNLNNVGCFLGFAGGFTAGNFFGVLIEKKLGIGTLVVRIITNKETAALVSRLRAANHGVTCLDGRGASGPVTVVFSVIRRKELGRVIALIKGFDPNAFYSVDDVQAAEAGVFPRAAGGLTGLLPSPLRLSRRRAA